MRVTLKHKLALKRADVRLKKQEEALVHELSRLVIIVGAVVLLALCILKI